MSWCAFCGISLAGELGLCRFHAATSGDRWADVNRIMCDFFHRRRPLPRLPVPERHDPYWLDVDESGAAERGESPRGPSGAERLPRSRRRARERHGVAGPTL